MIILKGLFRVITFFIMIGTIFISCATSRPTDLLVARTFAEAEEMAISIFWVYNDDIIDEIIELFPGETMAIWGAYEGEFWDEIASNYEVKMAQHGLSVATRARMRFINREFDFQFSGLVADNDIRSYGNMMGVSKIVLIEARRGGNIRDISVIDIERGTILYSANINTDLILEGILLHNNIPFYNPSLLIGRWNLERVLNRERWQSVEYLEFFSNGTGILGGITPTPILSWELIEGNRLSVHMEQDVRIYDIELSENNTLLTFHYDGFDFRGRRPQKGMYRNQRF